MRKALRDAGFGPLDPSAVVEAKAPRVRMPDEWTLEREPDGWYVLDPIDESMGPFDTPKAAAAWARKAARRWREPAQIEETAVKEVTVIEPHTAPSPWRAPVQIEDPQAWAAIDLLKAALDTPAVRLLRGSGPTEAEVVALVLCAGAEVLLARLEAS